MANTLPVVRSPHARALFLATAGATIVLLFWSRWLGSTPNDLHGLAPIFHVLFTYFDADAAMVMLGILVIAALVPAGAGMRPLLRSIGSRPILVAAITTVVWSLGALFVYRNHPLSMDEYAPYFQSQVFAAGHLTGSFPSPLLDWLIPHGFQNVFLNVSRATGEVTSTYMPSFALLLTPFTWLGIPWACNPVLSGITVLVIHRLAMRLFDNDVEVAGFAILFTVASPVFFADGISYYSMTAHMLANAIYALLLLQPTPRRLVAAGIVGSIAFTLHNPVPHLLFAIPWGIWLLTRERGVRNVMWMAAGYLPLSLLLGIGWILFSADFTRVADPAGASAGGTVGLTALFSLPTGTMLLARIIGLAKIWMWAVPGLLILAGLGAWRWRADKRVQVLAASAALTFLAYLFVIVDQGHGWGYRYFHSAWFVLPLLAAGLFYSAPQPTAEASAISRDDGVRAFVLATALLSLVIGVGNRGMQILGFMNDHLAQQPAYSGANARIEFINAEDSFYGIDLVQNDPFLRRSPIRMLSHGRAEDEKMMAQQFPDLARLSRDRHGSVWGYAGTAGQPKSSDP